MPFGRGVNEALLYYLGLADKLGFKTKNVDGYAGHVEFGEGEEIIGVLVHLDVVPEGDGWTYPPYSGQLVDNRIYGRGAIDDKGPAVSVLYGLKAIKDAGLKLSRRIRIIAGLDEESGWECMEYYFKHEEKPVAGFSPDAEFPIINSEKGILIFALQKSFSGTGGADIELESIRGGNRPNMVPDYCEAVLRCCSPDKSEYVKKKLAEYVEETHFKLQAEERPGEVVIKSYGISSHGSTPEKGQNAISQLLVFMDRIDIGQGDKKQFIRFMVDKIGMEHNGESLNIALEDKISGKLVFNLGVINLDADGVKATINIRYPIKYSGDYVIKSIEKELEGTGIIITDVSDKAPLYVPEDNFMIQKLKEVYREVTGENPELISIGGGTYARAIDNAVAFGPLFPGQPELAHEKDEFIGVSDLIKITEIYARAMYLLAK